MPVDNSVGRLLALSDGVFAIAMTLLALDLRVPDLGSNPTDAALRHALRQDSGTYLAFILSFYVVATYWIRHRRIMKSVVAVHPRLLRDTLILLLIVAAVPFPTSLLAEYGGVPTALALYGGFGAVASLVLILLRRDAALPGVSAAPQDVSSGFETWGNLIVFALCIPAGYLLHGHGPWVLLLIAVVSVVGRVQHRLRQRQTRVARTG